MVFKPINLARQSFVKTFTHGYAQSLVAASQSSSASQNTSFHSLSTNFSGLWAKSGPTQPTQHVHPPSTNPASKSSADAGIKSTSTDVPNNDHGLAAYYAAWQEHKSPEEKEWHQFQFAKRIGWKAPTTIPENQSKNRKAVAPVDYQERPGKSQLTRSRSTTAVDDLHKQEAQNSVPALPPAGAVQEKVLVQDAQTTRQEAVCVQDVSQEVISAASDSLAGSSISPTFDSSSQTAFTSTTSVSSSDSFTEHLGFLAESGRYAEIPPVFEAMLVAGNKPTASAYNALLLAAINLTVGKHQVVPKTLDVFADMIHRHVEPDTATYAILIELLAARALDVTALSRELTAKVERLNSFDQQGNLLLKSDQAELALLAADDSLSLAIGLFDTSAATVTTHLFPPETYRQLISACAEQGRLGDMVRIYADMESQRVPPPTSIFAPMIHAFARAGDLRSAIECYNEYKALAIANDNGLRSMVRKDEDVYAAVVQAYGICGQPTGGLKFFGRIEEALQGSSALSAIRDAVVMRALIPQWLSHGEYADAIDYVAKNTFGDIRTQALSMICVYSADKNIVAVASQTFQTMATEGVLVDLSKPAMALFAMHVRNADLLGACNTWNLLTATPLSASVIEPAALYGLSMIAGGDAYTGLAQVREVFARVRNLEDNNSIVAERITEALEVLALYSLRVTAQPSAAHSVALLGMMVQNGKLITSLADRLIAGLGPIEISQLPWNDFEALIYAQATLLLGNVQVDAGHAARLLHMVEITTNSNTVLGSSTLTQVQRALGQINRPDLAARLAGTRQSIQSPTFTVQQSPASVQSAPIFDDAFDPYASSTDFKGSAIITEELEKPYGSHSTHLSEALTRFKNMRRIGRHPRYLTYAKLITAAAKENKLNLATDILEMAKQDVPFISNSRIIRHGWVAILDSMVGACLTVGKRDMAAQYHQQLHEMGAAPSANTFGLYITTLKESTKTFDEATEAVKIFHRASAEGIEPSSFLYNALIGKLGKARRIDDCLFYFAEMRNKGIRPTSVTYGTIVNALCRVSDDKFAEELFEEMESMPNYKPRPAPYNSLMQYFLTTKRDRTKVLAYYERMRANRIEPTMHTYKLLIDTYATLEPVDITSAEAVLATIRASGAEPEAVHYASLIHAKGCVLHDLPGARTVFDRVLSEGRVPVHAQATLYQSLFESLVANHSLTSLDPLLIQMKSQNVAMTPYIANTLIHGWATTENITKAEEVYEGLGREKREPSTYEAMTRAYLAVEMQGCAMKVVGEALRRGYPSAVAGKILDLVGGGRVV